MTTAMIVQLAMLILPFVTPLVLRGVKALVPKMPTWVIPIAAPIVGAVATGLTAVATGVPDPGLAIAAGGAGGLMGVGVREIADQGAKAVVAVQTGKDVPRADDEKK